jgi:hypothetical protein
MSESIPARVADMIEDGMAPVRAFRVEIEITAGELSEDTGIPLPRIDAIEHGAEPRPVEVEILAGTLHVEPEVLTEAIAHGKVA